jgi:ketosteroid isomerase-like protein
MSENLDVVRSIYAEWKRGDFSSSDWAHADIEYTDTGGPLAGKTGALNRVGQGLREFLSEWEDFRLVADSYRELDDERVLVLDHRAGRSRASGLNLEAIRTDGARVFYVRDGTVRRLVVYFNREQALADLGLAE